MESIRVSVPGAEYDALIEKGVLEECGRLIAESVGRCVAAVVTDDVVAELYLETVKKSLTDAGFTVYSFVFPHGEDFKTVATYEKIIGFLASSGLTRSDIVVALGGGIPGDMAGFAAATYLRGIRFAQIPTTLLAAVDSSVGGKTAVNLPQGKNLLGAFHQPSIVICDPLTLDTLEESVFSDGCAEVIKYGVICDAGFFDFLENNGIKENIEYVIARCVELKAETVRADERENGIRAILNYGHTAAHAIEKSSGFTVTHGAAVGMGMCIEARGYYAVGGTKDDYYKRIERLVERNGLKTNTDLPFEKLHDAMFADKKRSGDMMKLIAVDVLGESYVKKLPVEEVAEMLKRGIE